jgi:hypothetical protein
MLKPCLLSLMLLTLALGGARAATDQEALEGYDAVSQALADDDLATAKIAAAALAKTTATSQPALATAADELAQKATLPEARRAFMSVSEAAVALAKGKPDYYIMFCPMVNADWVQKTEKLHNPYMGKAMLECGVRKVSP